MSLVVFTGWKDGINKIMLTRLISEYAGYPLTQAKLSVDAIIDNIKISVNVSSPEKAKELYFNAIKAGAICEIQQDQIHA